MVGQFKKSNACLPFPVMFELLILSIKENKCITIFQYKLYLHFILKRHQLLYWKWKVPLLKYLSCTEAEARRCSVKMVFLKMLQNLPENISDRIPFVKDFIEKLRRCFPENFKKILKRFFHMEHLPWLVLHLFSLRYSYW